MTDDGAGICYTRTGRRFFDDPALEAAFLATIRAALDAAGFRRVRLPGNILRFETAAILGAGLARLLVERARRAGDA